MKFVFDPAKDKTNQEKHGVALSVADTLDWERAIDWVDTRKNYQEERICALAPIGHRLYYVVYVDRDETRRIISLRKANAREVKAYEEAV